MHYTAFYDAHGCLRARNAKTGEIVDLLAELNRVAELLSWFTHDEEEDRKAVQAARADETRPIPWHELRNEIGLPEGGVQ